jgi:hypothetical protein
MNKAIAAKRAYLRQENRRFGRELTILPGPHPDQGEVMVVRVWRSADYLVQLAVEKSGQLRLSINRTMIDNSGMWLEEISWQELQRIKSECGAGDTLAVEIFPRDKDVVNVANMRHLWLMPKDFEWGWVAK